jgi:hypothetical protein
MWLKLGTVAKPTLADARTAVTETGGSTIAALNDDDGNEPIFFERSWMARA